MSDDNPRVESLFRAARYRPEFPAKGFADFDTASAWASRFVRWYNHEPRHSGIRCVSPADRHDGLDDDMLRRRHPLYPEAKERNPRRWARHTRNWSRIGMVTLNPERDDVAAPAAASQIEIQLSAA